MAKHIFILLCFVSIQFYVNAAENIENTQGPVAAIEKDISIDSIPNSQVETVEDKVDDPTQGLRQKRYFEYGLDAGVASYSPILPNYPSYVKRDNSQNIGLYGTGNLNEVTLTHIYRRLQEIANIAKRQYLPPSPPRTAIPIPTYIPFHVYVPGTRCGCESSVPQTPQTESNLPQPSPTDENNTGTEVDLTTRLGESEENSNQLSSDGSRPISFTPVGPKRPMKRPPPPVEHGSVQAGVEPQDHRYPEVLSDPLPLSTPAPRPPSAGNSNIALTATACDAAVLTCCHQSQITNDCFSSKGCTDPSIYADPCNKQLLLNVISKYQEIYKLRGNQWRNQ